MRTLYFDCYAGASGDMILGALVDLGLDAASLKKEIALIGFSDYGVEFEKVDRSGISSTRAVVSVPNEKSHRHLHQIIEIIESAALSNAVKARSAAIFERLAKAEARVHGIDIQKVHFHEVGAMDAIIDIVGSCIGFEMLGIEHFLASAINVGSGFVEMEHGRFPVPPPAVTELLKGIPVYSEGVKGELITPTGAAIISTVSSGYGVIPEMVIEGSGYGAGARNYGKFPNALRLIIGETHSAKRGSVTDNETEPVSMLETNLDDVSPQVLGFVMHRAFELGALDCWFTPIQMKKNRPAVLFSVLCGKENRDNLIEMIYIETTTLGIRVRDIQRHATEREIRRVRTAFGEVDVKIGKFKGRIVNKMPEYEQVKALALEKGVAFHTVHEAALAAVADISLRANG